MSINRSRVSVHLDCKWDGDFVSVAVGRAKRMTIRARTLASTGTAWALEVKRLSGGRWVSYATPKALAKAGTLEHTLEETDLAGAVRIGVFVNGALTGGDYGLVAVDFTLETDVTQVVGGGAVGGGGGASGTVDGAGDGGAVDGSGGGGAGGSGGSGGGVDEG